MSLDSTFQSLQALREEARLTLEEINQLPQRYWVSRAAGRLRTAIERIDMAIRFITQDSEFTHTKEKEQTDAKTDG